ncbi:class I SAM-dependent methyltransferase [Halalkalibacterium halodurans]
MDVSQGEPRAMNYEMFAKLYDRLMADAPYDRWAKLVEEEIRKAIFSDVNLLDIGCGTGRLLKILSERGYACTGVDQSANMLVIAREALAQKGVQVPLFQQDMTEFYTGETYQVITIFCDSLNYVITEEGVVQTFQRVFDHLDQQGVFMFDVHSPTKLRNHFIGKTFADADEEISYIWQSFAGEAEQSVEHELTFFVRNETGSYDRYEELHIQRGYPIERYVDWLKEAGFSRIDITADFTNEAPTENSERIFFKAYKK